MKDANAAHRAGTLSDADYENVLAGAVGQAVRMQEGLGLKSVTDGEFDRSSWFGFFFERMSGFRLEPAAFKFRDEHGASFEWPTCVACERIHRHRPITTNEFLRLRRLTKATPKITMPSPTAFHFFRFHAAADVAVYGDMSLYWDDLVEVYRNELADLARDGCTYVQLDEVPLAMLCDPAIRAQVSDLGADPNALLDTYVTTFKRILAGRPSGMTVGMHLCRGNFRSRWMASGGYEPVAERLFNDVPVDAFFLEYDTARAGDFAPLRFVPKDRHVVLGLISSKTPVLETRDALRRRIDDAARHVPMDRLALSPQCGFASVAGGNSLTDAEQTAKLALVVEVAKAVWG